MIEAKPHSRADDNPAAAPAPEGTTPMGADGTVQAIERLIAEQNLAGARSTLRAHLYHLLRRQRPTGSIADAVSALANEGALHQEIAAYLVRCLAVPNLLPSGNLLPSHLVALCERALPSLCRLLHLEGVRQTHEKLSLLATTHSRACDILSALQNVPDNLDDLLSSRQRVLHALNHTLITTYCRPFDVSAATAGISAMFSDLHRLRQAETDIKSILDDVDLTMSAQYQFCATHFGFFVNEFLKNFLCSVDSSVKRYVEKTRSRFVTSFQLRSGPHNNLQKRYPLQDEGRIVPISVPLRSTGPGTASGAIAKFETDTQSIMIDEELLPLGNIAPGAFSIIFHILVEAACDSFSFMMTIGWTEVGMVDRKEAVFVINVATQRSDIDWLSLVYQKPYSTEVAKGTSSLGVPKR